VSSNILNNVPTRKWSKSIKSFARYFSKLSVENDVLVYNDPNPVIVVTFDIILELSITVHYKFAHIGRDKLLDFICNLMWHLSRYKIVNDICTTCHQCQILKEFSNCIIPPTLKIATEYPFELMAADLVSLPRTANGNIGCLVIVDHYSKWVAVVPIKNKTSSTIVNALTYNVFPFLPRLPSKLLTDNGPEFVSAEFNSFLDEMGVFHQLTTPYCPTGNGAVERVNRTMQGFLRSLCTNQTNWDKFLPTSVIAYNNTYHSELLMSPVNFLLTKSHKVNTDLLLDSNQVKKLWRIGHPKFIPFEVGQMVLMRVQLKGNLTTNKLAPNYRGPFSVTKVNNNGVTYQLMDPSSQGILRAHHTMLL
jgi:hypothetical protein